MRITAGFGMVRHPNGMVFTFPNRRARDRYFPHADNRLRRRLRAVGRALFLLALAACKTPAILTPATGPGTSFPCGYSASVCHNGACCGEGMVCGGDSPGCPAGYCCDEAAALSASHREGGAVVPQRAP